LKKEIEINFVIENKEKEKEMASTINNKFLSLSSRMRDAIKEQTRLSFR
jgi:hypothetical protein